MARGRLPTKAVVSYVYLIANVHGHVKVGRSARPKTRVAEIATGSAGGATLVHKWRMGHLAAVAFEKTMHRACRPLRVSGEWFVATTGDLVAIGNHLASGDEAKAMALAAAIAAWHITREAQDHAYSLPHHWRYRQENEERQRLADEANDIARAAAIDLGAVPTELERWKALTA